MKTIPLTKGYEAIVDDEDYEWLNKFRWHVFCSRGIFYAANGIFQKKGKRFMHQVIMEESIIKIDHIDGNGLNNLKSNLRIATHSQNMKNRSKHKKGSSKFKGVHWFGKKWKAQIDCDRKHFYLGSFPTEIEAALAYDEAARKYHGDFARTNFE